MSAARGERRTVTLVIHRDDAVASRAIRLPLRALQAGGAVLGLLVLLLLGTLALYAPLLRSAARVPGLEQRIRELEGENAKVRELAAALDSAEAQYHQVRAMVGAEIVPDPAAVGARVKAGSTAAADAKPAPAPTIAATYRWPLEVRGFVTRGQGRSDGADGGDAPHPGIDVAVPIGTPVHAASAGTVRQSGTDSTYGTFVLLAHPDGHETMYGHLSRIAVRRGAAVQAGEVVGLSGNSGRSTAPHLHFEIRRQGTPVDPLTLVQEPR